MYKRQQQQRWKWESIQVKLFKISMKGMVLGQVQQVGSVFFSQTTSLSISFLSAKAVIDGNITLGMMMSISYILGDVYKRQVIGNKVADISLKDINGNSQSLFDIKEKYVLIDFWASWCGCLLYTSRCV